MNILNIKISLVYQSNKKQKIEYIMSNLFR